MKYLVYLLGASGRTKAALDVEAETDEAAIEAVTNMNRRGLAAEVWRGSLQIAVIPAEDAGWPRRQLS